MKNIRCNSSTKDCKGDFSGPAMALDPHNPDVFGDNNLISRLEGADQITAKVERAKHGLLVDGDPIKTLEALLIANGVPNVKMDGVLDDNEADALEELRKQQEDEELLRTMGKVGMGMFRLAFRAAQSQININRPQPPQQQGSPQQSIAASFLDSVLSRPSAASTVSSMAGWIVQLMSQASVFSHGPHNRIN